LKAKFERNYEPEEEARRKELFTKFLDRMVEHNKEFDEKKKSYSLGINQFADQVSVLPLQPIQTPQSVANPMSLLFPKTDEEIHQGRKPKNFAKPEEESK
jgi:hypothetical protein